MRKKRYGIVTERMHMVKTEDDKVFRFAKVIFMKYKLFSRELMPMAEDNGKQIKELKFFDDETKTFVPVDIHSFKLTGLLSYSFKPLQEGEA